MSTGRQAILPKPQKALVFLVERVSLRLYGVIFVGVVASYALAYWALTASGHGLGTSIPGHKRPEFADAAYFSLVTISSLGYGDFYPVGFSRVLACSEVLLGLLLMGVVVAKATSYRLAYHVERLFTSDIHNRVQQYCHDFDGLRLELAQLANLIAKAFDVPNSKARAQDEAKTQFAVVTERLYGHVLGFKEYIDYEIQHDRFFAMAPEGTMRRVAVAAESVVDSLGQMIRTMTPTARTVLMSSSNRQVILKSFSSLQDLTNLVSGHCHPGEVRIAFTNLQMVCAAMPRSFYEVPEVDAGPPNLDLSSGNEPQVA